MKTKLRLTTLLIYLMSLTSFLNAADINNLKMLANQGDKEAQYNLGYCYEYGEGVGKDLREAVSWYTRAAYQGDKNAQYNLGKCYYYGRGVVVDMREAVNWYTKAANQGHEYAKKIGRAHV